MKNVYMVQASTTYGDKDFKAAYLPYAAGLLVAYAFQNGTVKQNYSFKRFIFTREKLDRAVDSLEEPSFIGFSNYIWNTEYNKALAKRVKERYPDCIIVFGGHNVPPDGSFLRDFDYIDFLIHAEGEEACLALMLELTKAEPDFSHIANLSYRDKNGEPVTNPTEVLTKVDYPSPYLTGIFDDIIRENPDMQLDTIIETSRGCPRECAYCDWGCTGEKVRLFPIERVFAEIEWFGEHKTAFIWGADANFGAYERDEAIVDKFIEIREKTGYPERLRINYAKNNHERVFRINRKLEKYGLSKEGATLSFQSMNPDTLKAIGRVNMSMEKFNKLIQLYRNDDVTTYSELILGLPCETYDSFCKGIGDLLAFGQHRLINVYNCALLPNSLMARKSYREKYGIRSADIVFITAHSGAENEVNERSTYVIGTNTMSTEEWIKANIFACYVRSLHHYGVTKFIAIYLFYAKGVRYEDLYKKAIDTAAVSDDPLLNRAYFFLDDFYRRIAAEKTVGHYKNDVYGSITWLPEQVPHMDVIYRLEEYYDAVTPLFKSFGIEPEILNELFGYQFCALKRPNKNHYSAEFDHDWYGYFEKALNGERPALEKKRIRITVDNETTLADWREYAVKAAWFGKDGNTFNPGMKREFI